MTHPLDSPNPYGIRVAADRGPVREDVKEAFARGSRKASAGLANLRRARARRPAGRRSQS